MIIYEVNLEINESIFLEYSAWLEEHIQEMLTFKGFQKARLLQQEKEKNKCRLTVLYDITHREDLEDYLTHHAERMRKEGINRFGNKFNALRRIFSLKKDFS